MLKCQLCDYTTDSQSKLSKHTGFHHKLKFPDYLIKIKYEGIHPLCGCGCGEKMRYEATIADFSKFKHGHASRQKGFWNPQDPKRIAAIIKTRKEKFASGEYDYIKESIKKARKDPGLGKKISEGAKGVAKPKPEGFGIGRIQSEKTRKKMSDTAIQNIIKTGKVKRSKLEYKFEAILELLEIKYIHSYYIKSIGKIFDFYLPDYNVLIEVDGDFWHCNPIKFDKPQCKTQELNSINDKFKNEWALQNNFKLLRFWENDINNNITLIKKLLLENLAS